MSYLIKKFLSFLIKNTSYNYLKSQFKKKAQLVFLKTLQVVRKSLIAAILLFFILQLFVFSFVGIVVSSIWLIPELEAFDRWLILLSISGLLFVILLILFSKALSDKTWYKFSINESEI